MPEFHLWGRIEHLGPAEFLIMVSAVPNNPEDQAEVLMEDATSRVQAEVMLRYLIVKLGEQITRRGDRVIDVIDG